MTHPRARQPQAERVARAGTRADRPGYWGHLPAGGWGTTSTQPSTTSPDRPTPRHCRTRGPTAPAIRSLHRTRAFFATHGIARIQRIVTGNGAGYQRPRMNRPKVAARPVEIFADEGELLTRALQGDQIAVLPALFHLPRHRVLAADLVAGPLSADKRSGSA